MKYSVYVVIIYLLIFSACQSRHKEIKEAGTKPPDTIVTENKQPSPNKKDNLVKSEAPDAVTKSEQGYALPRLDNGERQSPINILSSSAEINPNHKVALKFTGEINAVENLGHTIQLDFSEGSTTVANGKTYEFKQLHFHTPSEHLIDGMTFPMEMHLVNLMDDKDKPGAPAYMVVAVLFKMGHENKFLKEFLAMIPPEENEKVNLQSGKVKLEDLFAGTLGNAPGKYFLYSGSLTTPPYTETVDWLIRKYIFEASPEQITALEKLEGDNARHVQALYERKVASN